MATSPARAPLLPALALALALPAATSPACAPVVPPNPANLDHLCDALCHRQSDCHAGTGEPACQAACRHESPKRRPYWRADYVDAIARCFSSATCDALAHDGARACVTDSIPEPSDTARRACRIVEAKQRECVGTAEDMNHCLYTWNWRVFSDPVLEEFIDCESQRCGANGRKMCVEAVLGND